MNHLYNIKKLTNRYFIMRHGESEANEQKLIISDPANGIDHYGLTLKGRHQVHESAAKCELNGVIIYSSDFKRAKETALTASECLGAGGINYSINLRERFFGIFEKTSNENYGKVWAEDIKNAGHKTYDAESPDEVTDRMTALIIEFEKKFKGKTILIVSHGDPLQMLAAAFNRIVASRHRSVSHLEVAEIRELMLL